MSSSGSFDVIVSRNGAWMLLSVLFTRRRLLRPRLINSSKKKPQLDIFMNFKDGKAHSQRHRTTLECS